MSRCTPNIAIISVDLQRRPPPPLRRLACLLGSTNQTESAPVIGSRFESGAQSFRKDGNVRGRANEHIRLRKLLPLGKTDRSHESQLALREFVFSRNYTLLLRL